MPLSHNVAGVWKTNIPKINVAGVWKTPTVKINVAGVWKSITNGPTVNVGAIQTPVSNITTSGTCYAGVDIRATGSAYRIDNTGGATYTGVWLTSGASNEVWVQRTINSGTLSTDEIGAGRVSCSTDRMVRIQTINYKTTTVTLYFYDAASGGNLLGTRQVILEAESGFN